MEIIQTITFTEDERDVIAGAFEVMDKIADGIKAYQFEIYVNTSSKT